MFSWHECDLNKDGSLIFSNGQRFIMSVARVGVSKIIDFPNDNRVWINWVRLFTSKNYIFVFFFWLYNIGISDLACESPTRRKSVFLEFIFPIEHLLTFGSCFDLKLSDWIIRKQLFWSIFQSHNYRLAYFG